jgi:hypothetical protein
MGKVVGDILVKDKEKKEKDRMGTVGKTLGVPFWGSGVEIDLEKSERRDGLAVGNDDPLSMLCSFKAAVGQEGMYPLAFILSYVLNRIP